MYSINNEKVFSEEGRASCKGGVGGFLVIGYRCALMARARAMGVDAEIAHDGWSSG